MSSRSTLAILSSVIVSFFIQTKATDENIWLEEVDSKKSLEWVKKTNEATDNSLTSTPLYQSLYQDALYALNSKDKLPNITQRGDWIYNYWKGGDNPRGLYRRATLASFTSGAPQWQTVLDIDKLSQKESTKWVFKGMSCLEPDNEKCLVRLSPGGGDAVEVREFNSKTLSFVEDGFFLEKSKSRVSWIDQDTLFVATDFGPDSMTDSGYPAIQKIWQRNTRLEQAKTILKVNKKAVSVGAIHYTSEQGDIDLLIEATSFWTSNYYKYVDDKAVPLNLPDTSRIAGAYEGKIVVQLQKDWSYAGASFKQGSVILAKPIALTGKNEQDGKNITLLVEPSQNSIIEDITVTSKGILVITLEDVKSRVDYYQDTNGQWQATRISLPEMGQISIETVNDNSGEFFARYEDFLTAPTLYSINSKLEAKIAVQQSATFDGSKFKVEQYFTKSKDGTRVPYFVVMNKNTKFNGKNPTHIFSYGGFRNSLTPSYSGSYEDLNGAYGKMWLERGGVFVLANIRGGGEYGPAWHAAALLENRYKSFEDFEAVAEDLANKKITSAQHLGIEGRSNGGLLVGATMTRRPELYGAVICGVPLLDMQRYHKLLAGASWMAEFGDPDTADWEFIKQYSPYQNLSKDKKYPPIFFFTSTRDDRVHPGHARKMASRMLAQGHQVEYYENMEGGHHGSSTSEQLAKRIALGFTHLWMNLK
ncbi:MAG: S9 family peptidase [Gammaproteobacteria bacterium]|nr:MAG: S9 family peptidase [Gammaproteobacteria bacterium]